MLLLLIPILMAKWSKSADWLSINNAKAQVDFWKKDLEYSLKYLKWVKSVKKIANHDKFLVIAEKDVVVSKTGLAKAEAKLAETIKRDGNS